MRTVLAVVIVLLVGTMLGGCVWFQSEEPNAPREATFTAEVVPPLTVVVDGRQSLHATRWLWDWGDGSPVEESVGGVARHTYASPGRYVVILTIEYRGGGAGGGGEEDLGPGAGGGLPPVVGATGTTSAYRVVDLLEADRPTPVIITMSAWDNKPGRVFFPWAPVHFYAGASLGDTLWFQWEVVYVVNGQPTFYPWNDPARDGDGRIEFMRSEKETFTVRLPGPGGCPRDPRVFTFRVRLWATDMHGRRNMAETSIYSTNIR